MSRVYCFYLQKGVRHFETTMNSGHEGTTNHAIKSGPSRVLPQHVIDKSAKIQLDLVDCHKFALYHRYLATALLGRATTWSSSPNVNHLTLSAEFILKSALLRCSNTSCWRTSNGKWLVVRSAEQEVHSLIPSCFRRRVYTITLQTFEHASCLMCDCNYFGCNGMVCQHLAHVKRRY